MHDECGSVHASEDQAEMIDQRANTDTPIPGSETESAPDTTPAPPPDFNPPPDLSAESIDSAINAITSPPSSYDVSPAPGSVGMSPGGGGAGGLGSLGNSIPHVESFSSLRPTLLALQRDSASDIVHSNSSASIGSIASDTSTNSDSAHLADMRDRLIESQAQARSAGPSRENSLDQLEWKVTEATPPIEPIGKVDNTDVEQTWNSVWPTAQTIQRATDTSLERHAENTRFPITAPISPFVTPTFSPALVGRASPAPPRTSISPTTNSSRQSPRQTEPFDYPLGFSASRRRSVSYEQPVLQSPTLSAQPVNIAKHQRSFSSSSATAMSLTQNPRAVPQSPLAMNGLSGSGIKRTPPASPNAFRPSSPAIRGPRRSAGSTRGRGMSVTSGEQPLLSVEEYRDPGPSVQRRSAPSPVACERVPSNDDVPSLRDPIPPPVTAPNPAATPLRTQDDTNLAPPLYAPLARPANLRRALSDFDTKPRPVPSLVRSHSLESQLENSPKRDVTSAEFTSPPPDAVQRGEVHYRPKKSPRIGSGELPPTLTPLVPQEVEPLPPEGSGVELIDEGDVLPPEQDLYMDVTFEDEGLTTLERIFLLSKSEFPFHRNYIARVIGDLLYDVDPCESVEYILPLISSFPLDEDEGVRESFAQEIHRILWYFYSTCQMTSPDEVVEADLLLEDGLFDRPPLTVDFFTPLLGSLLLNANTVVTEAVRLSVVSIIARLKGKRDADDARWGPGSTQQEQADHEEQTKSFPAQDGGHAHRRAPIPLAEKELIERELLQGIVIGMGSLSTDMPEDMYDEEVQSEEDVQVFQAQLQAEATAGRATSMNLIGALCEHYTGDEAVKWGFVEEVLRCQDGEAPVRAEGAMALAALAKIAPIDQIPRLIPLFDRLAADDTIQVRQSLCIALPALCRRIEDHAERRKFAVEALPGFIKLDEVRDSLLDVMGELVYAFHDSPQGPPAEIMQVYVDEREVQRLGEDWDTVAAFNFPAVCLTLGPARWSEISPLYHHLNTRATLKPRRSLAASVHELAKILEPDQCARDLMPVYHSSMAENDDIRELIFEHLDVFLEHLPQDLAWETYLDLAKGWKSNTLGGWRAREQLALHIPQFFRIFCPIMQCEVLDMMKDALLDPFAAVRDAATKGIPTSYEVLGDSSDIAHAFRETLLDLGRSPKYRQRLTFVRCLREFVKPPPNKQAFEDFFLPFLKSLSQDVVDVRLGLAQSVADLFVVGAYYAEKVKAPKAMYELAGVLAKDLSVDVRDTIRNVDLEHLDKHDTVPHEIKSPETVKRALEPDDLVPAHAPDQVGMGDRSPLAHSRQASLSSKSNGDADAGVEGKERRKSTDVIPDHMKQAKTDDHPEPAHQTSADAPARTTSTSSTDSQSPTKRINRPGKIDRTASTDMMSHLHRMVLRTPTSEFPSTLSPFFGTGLGVNGMPLPLGSPRPGPRTPGGTMLPALPKTPGSYLSSPSPSEPVNGNDPFASAFASATPERTPEITPVSPGGSVKSLDGS